MRFMESYTNTAASGCCLACKVGLAAVARSNLISSATPSVATLSDFAPVGPNDRSFSLSVRRDISIHYFLSPDKAAEDLLESTGNYMPSLLIGFESCRRHHLFQIGIRYP